VSRAQCMYESQHREVTRFYDGACLDLAHRCYCNPGTGRELLLSQARLFTEGPQPHCQDPGLFPEATVSTSSASPASHTATLE
jgi:hypothetical protein